jgi:Uma2 family endonuclease
MVYREKLFTAEDFFTYAMQPENQHRRLELEEGEVVEMASSRQINTVIAMRIGYYLNAHVIPGDLGYISGADGGYKLGSRTVRQPDVAFISKARHPALTGVVFPVAPDLAVEIVSPTEDVFKKVKEYIRAGTQFVWAVYIDEQSVDVFRPDADGGLHVQSHGLADTLSGGAVLPGFTLAVRAIFPETDAQDEQE